VAARFRVRAPTRPGIFTPSVTPRDPGRFELDLIWTEADREVVHRLGPVTVFASPEQAVVEWPEPPGDIGFLKEQQWAEVFATELVRPRPLRASVPGFAEVRAPADASAEILAPAQGYITGSGLVRAGQQVEAGDELGRLVPRLGSDSDVGALRVALQRARSRLALAERDVERLATLLAQGAVPERRVNEAEQERTVAAAEFAAAQARLEQVERGGSGAGIALRAPVGGEVIEVAVRPGAFVAQGQRVFRIAAPERRWLEVQVPERFAAALGGATGIWLDGEDREYGTPIVLDEAAGARIVQIQSVIEPVSRTASVTLEYPSALGPSLIGARHPAHVYTTAAAPRLALPRSAVIDDGGRAVVYVQTGGETFDRRPVELGIEDGPWVEVLRGVEAGERVVSRGAYAVKLAAAGGDEIGHGHAH
jgi:RND family efflux transporter MFP subunit